MIWLCGCVFDMVSLFWHLLQFCCVSEAPANDTGRESVQCYQSFLMAKELLRFLPWSTALADLSQRPLHVGTVFCCFSAPMALYAILSCCCLMDFFVLLEVRRQQVCLYSILVVQQSRVASTI